MNHVNGTKLFSVPHGVAVAREKEEEAEAAAGRGLNLYRPETTFTAVLCVLRRYLRCITAVHMWLRVMALWRR